MSERPRQRPGNDAELGFTPQRMVPWLNPRFLVGAAMEVGLSGLFGRYSDKREIQAALPRELRFAEAPESLPPYTDASYRDEQGNLWIDYAADVAEGFHPTYTVARALAEPTLDAAGVQTRRGRILVLGGDEVYPSASWPAYRDRFVGPYQAALPWVERERAPHMFAIPGNHDWYDGLTSFMRMFGQGSWIGGWRTRQQRSYFALRLSQRWSLWATDIQFDTYIDGPQLEYFRDAAKGLDASQRVILVTAKPSWVDGQDDDSVGELKKESSWRTLRFIEERVIGESGAQVAVTITGDKHHYVHYELNGEGSPRHRFTAGGGGAHTSFTHQLPASLRLRGIEDNELLYKLGARSPDGEQSKVLRKQAARAIWRVWPLGTLIGVIYAVLGLAVADALKDEEIGTGGELADSVAGLIWDAASPLTAATSFMLIAALSVFTASSIKANNQSRWLSIAKHLPGAGHGLLHVAVAGVGAVAAVAALRDWEPAEAGFAAGWLAALALLVVGFLLGRAIFALYLWLTNRVAGWHETELAGGLASTEYKNFLRLKIDAQEFLTVYPFGIRRCPEWRLQAAAADDTEPWFATDDPPVPQLLERPVPIDD